MPTRSTIPRPPLRPALTLWALAFPLLAACHDAEGPSGSLPTAGGQGGQITGQAGAAGQATTGGSGGSGQGGATAGRAGTAGSSGSSGSNAAGGSTAGSGQAGSAAGNSTAGSGQAGSAAGNSTAGSGQAGSDPAGGAAGGSGTGPGGTAGSGPAGAAGEGQAGNAGGGASGQGGGGQAGNAGGGASGQAGSEGGVAGGSGVAGGAGSGGWPCPPDDDPKVETILCTDAADIIDLAADSTALYLLTRAGYPSPEAIFVAEKSSLAWPAAPLVVLGAGETSLHLAGDRIFWGYHDPSSGHTTLQGCPKENCSFPGTRALTLDDKAGLIFDGDEVFWLQTDGVYTCSLGSCDTPTPLYMAAQPLVADRLVVDKDHLYFTASSGNDSPVFSLPRTGLSTGEMPTMLPSLSLIQGTRNLAVLDGWLYREGWYPSFYENTALGACRLPDCSEPSGPVGSGFGYTGSFGLFLPDPKGLTFVNTGTSTSSPVVRSSLVRCSLDGCSSLDTLASRSDGTYQALAADDDFLYVASSQRSPNGSALFWSRVQRVKK